MTNPALSVIIPALNEATYIDRLLLSLSNQSFKDFEVIVSDAESKDGSREVVESFKNKLTIRFVEAAPKGPAFGRNQGAKHANGDWLLFLDADDEIDDAFFIAKLIAQTEKKGWGTSSAKLKIKKADGWLIRFGYSMFYNYQRLLAHTKHPVAQGYCILTRHHIFKEMNGFNENIHYGEDNDYVSRAGSNYGFGFVNQTYYYVDTRRNQQEGLAFFVKNLLHELYRLRHLDNLEKQPFKYEFGKHKKRGEN